MWRRSPIHRTTVSPSSSASISASRAIASRRSMMRYAAWPVSASSATRPSRASMASRVGDLMPSAASSTSADREKAGAPEVRGWIVSCGRGAKPSTDTTVWPKWKAMAASPRQPLYSPPASDDRCPVQCG